LKGGKEKMKLIISGGRHYKFTNDDYTLLNNIKHEISEIVTGGATGADTEGIRYAKANGIPAKVFHADWTTFGKSAGHIRNREMAIYAEAVILFPGGKGTTSMYNFATEQGIIIFDYRKKGGDNSGRK
jgi:hypothetical protein